MSPPRWLLVEAFETLVGKGWRRLSDVEFDARVVEAGVKVPKWNDPSEVVDPRSGTWILEVYSRGPLLGRPGFANNYRYYSDIPGSGWMTGWDTFHGFEPKSDRRWDQKVDSFVTDIDHPWRIWSALEFGKAIQANDEGSYSDRLSALRGFNGWKMQIKGLGPQNTPPLGKETP